MEFWGTACLASWLSIMGRIGIGEGLVNVDIDDTQWPGNNRFKMR